MPARIRGDALRRSAAAFILQRDAGDFPRQALANQPRDPATRPRRSRARRAWMLETQLRSASVQAEPGREGQISPEAVGRGQARPLADQHDDHARAEHGADLVAQRDPRAGGDHGMADLDARRAPIAESGCRTSSTACALTADGDRPSPTTIASRHEPASRLASRCCEAWIEHSPQIGTPQIVLAVARAACDLERLKAEIAKAGDHGWTHRRRHEPHRGRAHDPA